MNAHTNRLYRRLHRKDTRSLRENTFTNVSKSLDIRTHYEPLSGTSLYAWLYDWLKRVVNLKVVLVVIFSSLGLSFIVWYFRRTNTKPEVVLKEEEFDQLLQRINDSYKPKKVTSEELVQYVKDPKNWKAKLKRRALVISLWKHLKKHKKKEIPITQQLLQKLQEYQSNLTKQKTKPTSLNSDQKVELSEDEKKLFRQCKKIVDTLYTDMKVVEM